MDLTRERVHRGARPDDVQAGTERPLHDAYFEAELLLFDAHFVRKDARRTGRIEKHDHDDSEDARDTEALDGGLQRVERVPLSRDFHHQEPPLRVLVWACAA